jgi:hypothetical protein
LCFESSEAESAYVPRSSSLAKGDDADDDDEQGYVQSAIERAIRPCHEASSAVQIVSSPEALRVLSSGDGAMAVVVELDLPYALRLIDLHARRAVALAELGLSSWELGDAAGAPTRHSDTGHGSGHGRGHGSGRRLSHPPAVSTGVVRRPTPESLKKEESHQRKLWRGWTASAPLAALEQTWGPMGGEEGGVPWRAPLAALEQTVALTPLPVPDSRVLTLHNATRQPMRVEVCGPSSWLGALRYTKHATALVAPGGVYEERERPRDVHLLFGEVRDLT